ncbi:MAG: hypothetical protein C0605_06510 [Hyphomicrobiales bacterium]|nr:MAG: hypothetical protein C0605_06510 [Hyphomicrobiales bacterium]
MLYSQVIRTAVIASLIGCFPFISVLAEEDGVPEDKAAASLAAAYECDRLATRPLDISSPAKGVRFEDVDAEPAIRACREASRKFPTTGRFFTQLGRALLKVKRLGQAGRALKKAEELSHPPALDIIGYMYENGFSVVRNAPKARDYYLRAAKPGDAYGQYNLGRVYLKGIGGRERREDGLKLLKKAAEKGVAEAMHLLGDTERTARGGDLKTALAWYEKAAQKDFVRSQNLLGEVYGEGKQVQANPEQAFKWTKKAAEHGSAEAQTRLGVFYLNGTGTAPDAKLGAEWLQKAADQDDGRAQAELGILYAEGRGVKKDYYQALRLFRKGIQLKEPRAYYHMGLMYESGLGVVESAERARQYYKQAADLGNRLAAAKLEEADKSVSIAAISAAGAKPAAAQDRAAEAPAPAKAKADPAGVRIKTAKAEAGPVKSAGVRPVAAAMVRTAAKPRSKSGGAKAPAPTPGMTRLSQLGLIGTLD